MRAMTGDDARTHGAWQAVALGLLPHLGALRDRWLTHDGRWFFHDERVRWFPGLASLVSSPIHLDAPWADGRAALRPLSGAHYWLSYQVLGQERVLHHGAHLALVGAALWCLYATLRTAGFAPSVARGAVVAMAILPGSSGWTHALEARHSMLALAALAALSWRSLVDGRGARLAAAFAMPVAALWSEGSVAPAAVVAAIALPHAAASRGACALACAAGVLVGAAPGVATSLPAWAGDAGVVDTLSRGGALMLRAVTSIGPVVAATVSPSLVGLALAVAATGLALRAPGTAAHRALALTGAALFVGDALWRAHALPPTDAVSDASGAPSAVGLALVAAPWVARAESVWSSRAGRVAAWALAACLAAWAAASGSAWRDDASVRAALRSRPDDPAAWAAMGWLRAGRRPLGELGADHARALGLGARDPGVAVTATAWHASRGDLAAAHAARAAHPLDASQLDAAWARLERVLRTPAEVSAVRRAWEAAQ